MRFTSRDVEEVESTWREFVPSATLERVDPRRFRFDWRSAELGDVALVRYDLAAQIHSTAEPHEQILVCRVDSPDAVVWSGRDALDPAEPWLSDGTRVQATWPRSATVRALVFDRTAAQERARLLTGHDAVELRATGLSPHSPEGAGSWERMFRYLDTSVGDEPSGDSILRAELERHALMTTLAAFPTTFSDVLRRPAQRSGAPATVRRALAYIDDNAHLAITVDDVAAAAFISTRGLQYAFRRALDITPAEALRRARLEGARHDLERGTGDTVGVVARRWGFSHPSRFAAAYRAAYGTHPSVARDKARA
ncbi:MULTISPECIES: helix-turn-helix domain-containing protein [unclassified Microbacterium]|uniref:helix-turn-helix domain-containing protein n=1 Tax=unclassified Microbacterium TaxID=2609290 RepID=UPI000EAA0173|nr:MULTISPECIES: AraC family transcriptional regulator [unclassified Microbacterium]MBT2485856.1 helix-turn-helix transcriptional regulator [Microbacterium sp. ISL-108]RKN68616.1 AraC family transcriptional regulator [Microbacterium sp. CGR2]